MPGIPCVLRALRLSDKRFLRPGEHMKQHHRPSVLLAALFLTVPLAMAQNTAPPTQAGPSGSAADVAPAGKTFSQQELDQLLAPIALYPDALLAQVLMASTYPLEVVQAARWAKDHPKVTGKALEDAMAQQPWDPAVKALTAVPQVLQQMNDRLEWTQKLGDAFLAQQKDVMNTVQALRAKADASGNLKSSSQMTVNKQAQGNSTVYVIESPKPEVVYVPTYNPTVVYGTWPYPQPPYYVYPPGYAYAPGLTFAAGMVVGAAIWGNCNWGHGDVDVNVNRYNTFNHTNVSNTNWNHNAAHRQGVAYRDPNVARQYQRGGDRQAAQARENFRGRAESGRGELSTMDRNQLNDRVRDAQRGGSQLNDRQGRPSGDRAGAQFGDRGGRSDGNQADRGNFSGRSADSGRGRDNGLSGIGNGASTREASQRGASSRNTSTGRSAAPASRGSGGFSGGGSRGGGGGRGGRR